VCPTRISLVEQFTWAWTLQPEFTCFTTDAVTMKRDIGITCLPTTEVL
jgi:hypothetical protein